MTSDLETDIFNSEQSTLDSIQRQDWKYNELFSWERQKETNTKIMIFPLKTSMRYMLGKCNLLLFNWFILVKYTRDITDMVQNSSMRLKRTINRNSRLKMLIPKILSVNSKHSLTYGQPLNSWTNSLNNFMRVTSTGARYTRRQTSPEGQQRIVMVGLASI